jgi:hypothetical protein
MEEKKTDEPLPQKRDRWIKCMDGTFRYMTTQQSESGLKKTSLSALSSVHEVA